MSKIHDENWTFPCVCGSTAVARFVIPTNKARFAIIGTCDACARNGNDPTTTAILPSTEKDGIEILLTMCPIMLKEKS